MGIARSFSAYIIAVWITTVNFRKLHSFRKLYGDRNAALVDYPVFSKTQTKAPQKKGQEGRKKDA